MKALMMVMLFFVAFLLLEASAKALSADGRSRRHLLHHQPQDALTAHAKSLIALLRERRSEDSTQNHQRSTLRKTFDSMSPRTQPRSQSRRRRRSQRCCQSGEFYEKTKNG
ncbi:hypothetical protein ACOMHN_049744 [Nucella lapillus]